MKKKLKKSRKPKSKPLDPQADFDTPVRSEKTKAKAKAKTKRKPPAQGTLITLPPANVQSLVQNDRMAASYVKPHFERNKKGERFVSLEVSMHLTKDHDGMLPKQIEQGWDFMGKEGNKRLDIIGVKPQQARFYLTSAIDDCALEIPAARVTHVSLQVIEEKGTGKANKIIRLSFRLKVQLSRDVAHFSEWNFGDNYWLEMEQAQGNLLEETEEEDPDAEEEEETEDADAAEEPDPEDADKHDPEVEEPAEDEAAQTGS